MITPFWLDASVLIEAKNRWYPFEYVPKFWGVLAEEVEEQRIRCPKAVYDELSKGNDQLAVWIRTRKQYGICVVPNKAVQDQFKLIADHVADNFPLNQAEEFLTGADPWLIATAKVFGGTVVTGESESRKRKIRIPVICKEFFVPYIDLSGMIRAINKQLS